MPPLRHLLRAGPTVLVALTALLMTLLPVQALAADRGEWAPYVAYSVGDIASYAGRAYDCRQSHTSLPGWEPPNVLALWLERSGPPPVDTQAPSTPSQVTSPAKTYDSVSLSWGASTDNVGVTGYEIFVNGGTSASATTSGATSVTVTGLAANTTYTFTVKARDAAGNRSAASAAYSTTTPARPDPDVQAPSAPGNLRSTGVSGSSVSLAWNASTDNVGVTGYEIFVNGGTSASATTTGATSVTVTGLAANTSYTFTAKARDAAGNRSVPSNSVSATTTGPQPSGSRVIVGYWHNFDNGSTNIRLRDVSPKFNVIQVAFAEPAGSASNMTFTPYNSTVADFKADIAYLKSQGRKVLISIGGANGTVHLDDATARQTFVTSMQSLIDTYGFDGMDLDLEGSSLSLNGGDTDFRNPTTPRILNLIQATRDLLNRNGAGFMLTMAPETAYVQGGMAAYGGPWGAYLPVIHALRDRLTYLHVQHYNTGTVMALDGRAYAQSTPDFHVAMAEMLLQGFPVGGNTSAMFPALSPEQVVIGLPSSPQAAGGGYTTPANVQKALDYLIKGQSFGGTYVLRKTSGYPGFKGLMTWSINWDKFTNFEFSNSHRAYLDALP
ncbi:fibronectin type III domain-containing protein [Pyxidicoccus parkwayensis]|uniref:chitinase n=1 Tax=Pyxidicoccus parkwayensis TaxID=2813578 RepID=A0ABX7NKY5_9BACT|nr:glycosyl hydrolase family 18 protein [Pyxidicoccus parkwaysis]QSQ19101.1 fibronectin type III domain-containing protein [Pyxidicoccus parkwaysis]